MLVQPKICWRLDWVQTQNNRRLVKVLKALAVPGSLPGLKPASQQVCVPQGASVVVSWAITGAQGVRSARHARSHTSATAATLLPCGLSCAM
jgi:hypothetical protein